MDINKIKKILPHRYPLLLVDRITRLEKDVCVEGYKNVTANEQIFLALSKQTDLSGRDDYRGNGASRRSFGICKHLGR